MRAASWIGLAFGLAACAPVVPDSGPGFQDYDSYLAQRTAEAPAFSTDSAAAAIARADAGALPPEGGALPEAPRPRGNAPAGIKIETGEAELAAQTVSDEQDFAAVSARETIESDKARIERNRATYTVDQPAPLPQRDGSGSAVSIVEFALNTTNAPGTPLYKRSRLQLTKPEVACAKFQSSDAAQAAFLANGGPERDRKNVDPDGDGFACAWDPRPFRTALQ